MPRKNQMAKGIEAKIPDMPLGKALAVICSILKWGSATPAKTNSSNTAKMVIKSSNLAAAFTPKILNKIKNDKEYLDNFVKDLMEQETNKEDLNKRFKEEFSKLICQTG
jgi:hypothetical protein